jgi:DNA polymerase III epsilon subunit family exonuclease
MAGGFLGFLRARRAPVAADRLPPGVPEAQRYVVFDLETTGLRPSRGDAILQIGALRIDGGTETGRFETLVKPARRIPPAATRFHGITDAMVADAPAPAEAVAAFRDFAAGAVLVAHNAAFDLTALRLAAERDGAPHLSNAALCSMRVAGWLDPQEPDMSLGGLCGRAGISIHGRHQALADAEATAALWTGLLARLALRGVADLGELAVRTRMQAWMEDQARHF